MMEEATDSNSPFVAEKQLLQTQLKQLTYASMLLLHQPAASFPSCPWKCSVSPPEKFDRSTEDFPWHKISSIWSFGHGTFQVIRARTVS